MDLVGREISSFVEVSLNESGDGGHLDLGADLMDAEVPPLGSTIKFSFVVEHEGSFLESGTKLLEDVFDVVCHA